jgi:uncharacterized protein DUF5615
MGTAAETTGAVSGAPGNVPDALLLDEMLSPAIAIDLTAHGIDCRAVVGDPVLRAQSDLEIFQAALAEGRILVTNNVQDFESLRRAHEAAGDEVPGLIYTSDLTFPRTKAYVSRLAAALTAAAVGRETARCGGVLWLLPGCKHQHRAWPAWRPGILQDATFLKLAQRRAFG